MPKLFLTINLLDDRSNQIQNDNQFNDLDEFDLMFTIMQIIKQYCTK